MKLKFFGYEVKRIDRSERALPVSDTVENRSSLADPSPWLLEALGGLKSRTGIGVNEDTALNFSAVFRATAILASSIASLPLDLFQKTDSGRQKMQSHPASRLISEPSPDTTGFVLRESMQASLSLWGNAYAYIHRDSSGRFGELEFVKPKDVYVDRINRRLWYTMAGIRPSAIPYQDVIHIPGLSFDGVKGKSVIACMREAVGLGLAAQDFGATFFGNGASLDGVIETPGELTDASYNRLKNSWNSRHTGLDKAHGTAILEGGSKYTRIGIPPEDAQFLETRKFQVTEIARYFGVAPHLLYDLERSTNNNIEAQGVEFVQYSLMQFVRRWDDELTRKLLTPKERETMYFRHNLNGLMRADTAARSSYYNSLIATGVLSPNQVAALEDLPTFDGGDQHFMQAGYAPIELLSDFYKAKLPSNEQK